MLSKAKVLFLCTGNSCRSQMAEAWLRHLGGELFEAYSAGTDPKPIHPLTFKAMEERGVSMEGQRSKGLREYLGKQYFGYVIVVCSEAAQTCPTVWPGVKETIHMLFDDPAAAQGSEEEKLAAFRRIRDEIEAGIRDWLARNSERAEEIAVLSRH